MAGITQADKRSRGCSTKIQIILVYIVTGPRSKRAYASLDAYELQQTLSLIFLVEVHGLVVCFTQNRFLNSAALRGALSMTYSCEVRGKTAPKVSQHCKVSSYMEHPPFPSRSHFIPPLIFYYTNLRNGKSICLEWYVAIRIGPHFYVVFHCMIQLVFKTVWVPFSSNFIFLLKSSAEEFF